MNKIICDVCGTSYPETANQCPICGCVRPSDAVTVSGDTNEMETTASTTYTYVKGGRFSKANVKKRNQGKSTTSVAPQSEEPAAKSSKSDVGMIITVLALLLAIVAIVIYMMIRFFFPGLLGTIQDANQPVETTGQVVTTELVVPCKSLEVSNTVIEFTKENAALLLNVTPVPANTTDEITYETSDETVAVVSEKGKVVAVGSGEAIITITCGDATAQCLVKCTMEPEVEETTVPVYPTDNFKLNREDFTLGEYGQTHTLYKGEIPVELITWTTDDENVVTIENGVVTAVGKGYTTVYAEYLDIKLSCIVRCADSVKAPASNSTQSAEPAARNYVISHDDVTIAVGKSFTLTLKNKEGKTVDVTWISANSGICTVVDGVVTGVKAGQTTVTTTVDGETYSCIVRVTK